MRFNTRRSQVGWVVAMCAVLLSWESAHGVAVRAQELVVGPGETRKLPAGRHRFESVELADGAAIELADGHTVIETARLSTDGTSSIRSDKSHAGAEKKTLELVVLDTADMAGALVIDGSGIAGQAGAHNGGGVGGAGRRGEDGMTVDVTLVHRAGLVDLIERFIDGRGFAAGRLKVISRGGGGGTGGNGGTTVHYVKDRWMREFGGLREFDCAPDWIYKEVRTGHTGGDGGDGGKGGEVSVRFVMWPGAESADADLFRLHEPESSEPGKRRRIAGKDFSSVRGLYTEGLGVDIDVAPGAAGKRGASSPGHGPVAPRGKVGSAGSVTVKALDWESWAETLAGRRWLDR